MSHSSDEAARRVRRARQRLLITHSSGRLDEDLVDSHQFLSHGRCSCGYACPRVRDYALHVVELGIEVGEMLGDMAARNKARIVW